MIAFVPLEVEKNDFSGGNMRSTALFIGLQVTLLILLGATVANPWLINPTIDKVSLSPWELAIIVISLATSFYSQSWGKVARDKPAKLPSQNTSGLLKGLAHLVGIVSGLTIFINSLQNIIVWSALLSFVAGVNAYISAASYVYPERQKSNTTKHQID